MQWINKSITIYQFRSYNTNTVTFALNEQLSHNWCKLNLALKLPTVSWLWNWDCHPKKGCYHSL